MIIPAAMNIYSGADMLKKMDPRSRELQRREFAVIGDARAREYGASGLTEDLTVGYELGLATARAILFGSAELVLHRADPSKVL